MNLCGGDREAPAGWHGPSTPDSGQGSRTSRGHAAQGSRKPQWLWWHGAEGAWGCAETWARGHGPQRGA